MHIRDFGILAFCKIRIATNSIVGKLHYRIYSAKLDGMPNIVVV